MQDNDFEAPNSERNSCAENKKIFLYESAMSFFSSSCYMSNEDYEEGTNMKFETHLLKDRYGSFVIFDAQYSIKCKFEPEFLSKFEKATNKKIGHFEGKLFY